VARPASDRHWAGNDGRFKSYLLALALALIPALASPRPARVRAEAAPRGPALAAGTRTIPLTFALDLRPREGSSAAAIAWQAEGDAVVGTASEPTRRTRIRLTPADDGAVSLQVTITYLASVAVEREAVRLRLPGEPRVLRRDLSFEPLRAPLRVDVGTPVLAATPALVLTGGTGITAARYEPVGAGAERGVEVELVLDDADAHPFAIYQQCIDRIPQLDNNAVSVQFAPLEKKRPLGQVSRRPGMSVAGQATLYLIHPGTEFLPVVVERWPRGAQAAVVFSDHADRTDAQALRALLHGTSDPAAPGYGRGGFLGRGLAITRSFFAHASRGGLDDPEIRPLAEELVAAGSEVAVHSITGSPDDRDAVRQALPALGKYRVTTWIDHEPYTNCEAISNQGWRDEGKYGIRDLLARGGFRWLWEAGDLAGFGSIALVNLFRAKPDAEANPPIYPLPIDGRLWVFQSSMFYARPDQLAAAMEEAALDRFERERGLFVGHTYLAASAKTTSRPEHLARLLVHSGPNGSLVLDREFDAGLARLEDHVRRGTLASMTLTDAGDRLRSLSDVAVRYLPGGVAAVENLGTARVRGLTVAVPGAGIALALDGAIPHPASQEEGRSRVWFELAPGERVLLRADQRELPYPLLQSDPAKVVLQ
jgi:hypothetical protein